MRCANDRAVAFDTSLPVTVIDKFLRLKETEVPPSGKLTPLLDKVVAARLQLAIACAQALACRGSHCRARVGE
jgi:hypothetical protein